MLKTEHTNHETYKNMREARMSRFQYIESFIIINADTPRWEIFHHLSLKRRPHNSCPLYGVQVTMLICDNILSIALFRNYLTNLKYEYRS
jgi:hypothetical protein